MIANRTTKVAAGQTVSEIQAMLIEVRASSMMIDFENSEPSAITFQLRRGEQNLCFRLPSNWQGILAALKRDKSTPQRLRNEEHARRVSWRVVRDWLRAQLTLIEAGAATLEEVMVPWLITNDGSTVAKRLFSSDTGLLALPAPQEATR